MLGVGNDCLSPIYLNVGDLIHDKSKRGAFIRVRCGHCFNCKLQRTQEWSLRLAMEAQSYPVGSIHFVTLTFNDDNVWSINQETGELVQSLMARDVQLYMKRIRKALPKGCRIRYYACGEYGPKTHRPHYHLLVFGVPSCYVDVLETAWNQQGFVCIKPFFPETCCYVAGYIQKKLYGEEGSYEYESIVPPFSLKSHHLGEDWFFNPVNYDNIVANGFVMFQGYKHAIPRTFRRKMVVRGDLSSISPDEMWFGQMEELKALSRHCNSQGIDMSHFFKCFFHNSVARSLRRNLTRDKEIMSNENPSSMSAR